MPNSATRFFTTRFLTRTLLLGASLWVASVEAAQPKKIVLLAGPITGHPKDAHEYEKSVILLKHLLDTSPSLRGKLTVEAHFKGWPNDPATLDTADTVVLISDGGDHNLLDHPLYVGERFAQLERQIKRGCGFMQFHWTTFNPVARHEQITEWVGGYFDYESGSAPNHWRSAITTKDDWTVTPASPEHPICRGVKPFKLREEFYHHIRFRDNDARLKPIVSVGPSQTNEWTVGWAVERADGGRGFGFTGGHFFENWWNDDYRQLILNAIVWTAGVEVPAGGVESKMEPRIKALILTGHNHPAHDWNPVTAALLLALEQDPRMAVHVSESIEDLATPKIDGYELLVLNYANWERPGLSAAGRENFLKYLNNGGGLALVHFANGAWHPSLPNTRPEDAWPEFYTKICRRVWEHRPPNASGHDAFGPFHVEVTAVKHPITAGLAAFDTVDELYFRQAGDEPIEPLVAARSKVAGKDQPLAWTYSYAKARVFQTVLGHADVSVRKAAALIRRGCVWAAGREQLGFDPPAELTEGALFRDGSPWKPRAAVREPASSLKAVANKADAAVAPAPRLDATGLVYETGRTREETLRSSVQATAARFGAVRVREWQGPFVVPALAGQASVQPVGDDGKNNAPPKGGTPNTSPHWQQFVAGEFQRAIEAEQTREVTLRIGSKRPVKLALNGQVLASNLGPAGWLADQLANINEIVPFRASLRPGTNLLTAKFSEPTEFYFEFDVLSVDLRAELDARLAADFPVSGEARYYRIETIPVPPDIVLEVGGLGFTPDGTLMICTRRGEIWKFGVPPLSGLGSESSAASDGRSDRLKPGLRTVRWSLFASGLHEPLGLWPGKDGEVFLVQRSELTRVADTDGDGEADLFETLDQHCGISDSQHSYSFGPVRDRAGNFWGNISHMGGKSGPYYGWTFKVTSRGEFVPWSSGLRSPNGICITPDDELFVTDNQGEWVGTSPLHHVSKGAFHGHPGGLKWDTNFTGDATRLEDLQKYRKPPAVLFPYGSMGQSLSEPRIDTTGGKFGPFAGQMFVGDQTKSCVLRVALEKVDGEFQGACFPFRSGFQSGINRMVFAPDGSLLVGQTDRGWGSLGGKSYGLQRLVWTGETPLEIQTMQLTPTGFALTFTRPLDTSAATNRANYSLQRYHYLYRAQYGSPQVDNTPVAVEWAELSADRRTVSLRVAELRAGEIYELNLRDLRADDGAELLHPVAYYTLNRLVGTAPGVQSVQRRGL
ncbi:MAG: ThuA domain-containing protein [Verrucomicrobia bacterium]|nr:ThuA domain-containing protein [Verrucomicrobiota bacterium]